LFLTDKGDELIEDMKIALSWTLADDAAFLEEVVLDRGMIDFHGFAVYS
jgi:hypothetical protein